MAINRRIYLDYNATSPIVPEARAALIDALDLIGNPSSVHDEGRSARAVVEKARRSVAKLVRADQEALVFTGSATEAAATALTPNWIRDGRELTIGSLAVIDSDHPATRGGGRFPPGQVTRIGVDADGLIDLDALSKWLDVNSSGTSMVAVGLANGETGVVHSAEAIRSRFGDRDVLLVVDAAQAAGRIPLDIERVGADAMLLSGHKVGAAKGVGALVLRNDGLRPFLLIPGGGQERGLRSGTEALPAVASFGAAADIARKRAEIGMTAVATLRDRLVETLRTRGAEFRVLGEDVARLGNTVAFTLAGRKSESVQIALDLQGFAVSAGSACSSGKVGASHTLAAMVRGGAPVDPDMGLLRISLGFDTTADDVDALAAALGRILAEGRESGRDPLAA